jgi:hypothetical protein
MKNTIVPLRKQQQGMGHLLVVGLAILVVGVVGFAGWKVASKNSPKASTNATTTSNKTEVQAATTSCVATYHDANLCNAVSHFNTDKIAHEVTFTATGASGNGTVMIKYDGKGNSSTTMTGGSEAFNSITLDGNTYEQSSAGGVWYEYPSGTSSSSSSSSTVSDPTSGMNLVLGSGNTYKPMGTVACGSMTCFKYEVVEASTPGTTTYVLFDNHDYLLRGLDATDSNSQTFDVTFSYPSSVVISKPSPVQSMAG